MADPDQQERELIDDLLRADLERQGPPVEFDRKGCLAVLALLAGLWIAVGGGVWATFETVF